MKHKFINISENRINELRNYIQLPVLVIAPRLKKIESTFHKHHHICSILICDQTWTFLTEISVNGGSCNINVECAKFLKNDFIPYGGVEDLLCEIDTEADVIYYFQELVSSGIVNYVLEGMSQEFIYEFNANYLK